jgi:hypothetical protein
MTLPAGTGDGYSVRWPGGTATTGTLSFYRCWTPGLARLIAVSVTRWKSWHRWTATCLLVYIYLAVALQRQQDAGSGLDAGLIPITVPELLRLLRDTAIPPPGRDRLHWSALRRRHEHGARQAHQRWDAYAKTPP